MARSIHPPASPARRGSSGPSAPARLAACLAVAALATLASSHRAPAEPISFIKLEFPPTAFVLGTAHISSLGLPPHFHDFTGPEPGLCGLPSMGPAPAGVFQTPFRIGETEARTAQLFGWVQHIVAPHAETPCAPGLRVSTAVSVPENGVIRDVRYSLEALHGGEHTDDYVIALAAFSIIRPGVGEKRGYVHGELGRHLPVAGSAKKRAAILSGHNCVPPSNSDNFGCLVLIADDLLQTVSLGCMTDEINPQSITGAHIHIGQPGQNGPIAFDLGAMGPWQASSNGSAAMGIFEVPFPAGMMPMLLGGNCYIDIHTTQFPDGAVRGQIQVAPAWTPTGVEPSREEDPADHLSPRGESYNTPNPFLGGTTIHFALSEPSPVTLRVFDAAGRVVRSLLDQRLLPTGPQSAVWDGTTSKGEAAPAGAYFFRIESGTRSEVGRMILVR